MLRGAIGGIFSGHLGTGLHLGTIKPVFTKNTKDFQTLLRVIVTLALVSGITIGAAAWIFGVFLWNATLIDLTHLLSSNHRYDGIVSSVYLSANNVFFSFHLQKEA